MIVAKYRYIHDKITKDLQHIDRRYRAHVKGRVKAGGTIRLPIYKEEFQMKRMMSLPANKLHILHHMELSSMTDITF